MGYIDREKLQKEIDHWRIPGCAVTVFGDGWEETACLGYRDKEGGLAFDEDTLFCVASLSKSMTSGLIAALVAEGTLDYDRPIKEFLPEFQLWDREASEKFTLRDMLTHSTGFGAHDILWPADRAELAKRMRYIEPMDRFRGRPIYSNVIYALIGYVAEAVTGKTWPALMQEYIFGPLGMTRTSCTYDRIVSDPNHAEPYYVMPDGKLTKVPFWDIDGGGPAASVNTTIGDLRTWVRFQIDGGKNAAGEQIIPEEVFREIHKKQVSYPEALAEDLFPCSYYGFGWRVGEFRGRKFCKHTGKIEGYSSFQGFLPEERIGVAVMSNLHNPAQAFQLSTVYALLDKVLGYPEKDWIGRFHGGEAHPDLSVYLDCFQDIAGQRLEGEGGAPMPRPISDYAGVYENPGHGPIAVKEAEGGLTLHYRDQELPLLHWGGDTFILENARADTQTMRLPVTFLENVRHEVIKVKIPYEPEVQDIVFVKEK